MAERLISRLGDFAPDRAQRVWTGLPDRDGGLCCGGRCVDGFGAGVLPILALVATAPEVAAFHAGRGVSPEVSTATLADLGRQVRVHRLTYGEFGLHTQDWLELVWSGALYELGRLQFNLQPGPGETWVLSTHIPRTGPLTSESVDASFATARVFFATRFPDYPTQDIHCESWLLDPAVATLLPRSNLAGFQRRWQPYGPARTGDDDVLFFVFNRRGPVDLATLPTDTALRRAVVTRMAAGEHWSVLSGRLP